MTDDHPFPEVAADTKSALEALRQQVLHAERYQGGRFVARRAMPTLDGGLALHGDLIDGERSTEVWFSVRVDRDRQGASLH